jgi:hypothetical protein
MGEWMIRSTAIVAVIIIAVLTRAAVSPAGEWHTGSSLVCLECHTVHYSGEKESEPGGPFIYLLSHSTINGLCLSCHDGRNLAAPDVLSSVTMYQPSGDEHSAAGYFSGTETNSDSAHNLGVMDLVPLRSPPTNMALSCASCHEVHGSQNHRNLIPDPDSSGVGISLIPGVDVFQGVAPAVPPTPEGSLTAYRQSNVGYRSNLSAWCAECHNLLSTNEPSVSPAHFRRHPCEVSQNVSGSHTDPYHWVVGEGCGFGAVTGDEIEGVPRVRFQEPAAVDYTSAKAVASTNQVFCASCHLAHGGRYLSSAVWPYKEAVADMYSPCQQCHNQ